MLSTVILARNSGFIYHKDTKNTKKDEFKRLLCDLCVFVEKIFFRHLLFLLLVARTLERVYRLADFFDLFPPGLLANLDNFGKMAEIEEVKRL